MPRPTHAPAHRRASTRPSRLSLPTVPWLPDLTVPALRRRGAAGLVGAGLCVAAAAGSLASPAAAGSGSDPAALGPARPELTAAEAVGAADAAEAAAAHADDTVAAERAAAGGQVARSAARLLAVEQVEPVVDPIDALRPAAERAAAEAARVAAEQAAAAAAEAARVVAEQAAAEAARVAAEQAAAATAEEARRAIAWVLPTSGYRITARFGAAGGRWAANHTGLDFAAPSGTPVVAVHTGKVSEVGFAGPYGRRIVITHADGTQTWYCHLSAASVGVGETVGTGDRIGAVGSTGNSTGPHLHLEVRPGDSPVDPRAFLTERGATP